MGAGLQKMLSGCADEGSFKQAFRQADKNKDQCLDEKEIVCVVEAALELLSRTAESRNAQLSVSTGTLSVLEWTNSGPAIKKQVCVELARALFAVLDLDESRAISYEEWKKFDWSRLLPQISAQMELQKQKIVASSRENSSSSSAAVSISGPIKKAAVAPPTIVVAASTAPPDVMVEGRGLAKLPEIARGTKKVFCGENALKLLPELPDSLIELHAQGNQLRSVPLLPRKIVRLRLDGNRLEELPDFTQLQELALLWLNNNPDLPEHLQRNVPSESDQLDRAAVSDFVEQIEAWKNKKKSGNNNNSDNESSSGSLSSADNEQVTHDDAMQQIGLLGLMLSEEHKASLTPKVQRK